MRVWLAAVLCLAGGAARAQEDGAAPAEGGIASLVDRLSERLDAGLLGAADGEAFRAAEPAARVPERATVAAVAMGEPAAGPGGDPVETLRITVRMPGEGPRLFLVDAGAVFRGPGGADYVAVPNQRFILDAPEKVLDLEALPVWASKPRPAAGTPLTAVWSNDPGLITLLRTVQHIEAANLERIARYVTEKDGQFTVNTFVDNQDVRLARWMTWSRNIAGRLEGRVPRDGIRFAILAVTSGYTIQETADDLRLDRSLDMEPAIQRSWAIAKQTEYLLERAGLNFRVFSPNHADFHFNLGVARFRQEKLEEAVKAFGEALKRNPDMVDAQFNLGVTLYRQGDYPGADRALLIASGMKGAGAEVFYNRGAVQFRLGDKLAAARNFRQALTLNPQHVEAERWLKLADPEDRTKPEPPPEPKSKKKRKGRRR